MDRTDVLCEIWLLAAKILSGQADEEEIRRVTTLAFENNCREELHEELNNISEKILHKPL